MKQLTTLNARNESLRSMIESVTVLKIYYVWTGRNAWWSTWSTRYAPGCFHRTFESAKASCEKRRKQGTVFYIDELPSLGFLSRNRTLIVSEINTDRFLSRLDFNRLASVTTAFPVSTMTLEQMWHLFRVEGPLWPANYPKHDSIFLSVCSDQEPFDVVDGGQDLFSFMSQSSGPNYYMNWHRRKFSKDRALLHSVCHALSSRL